MDKKAILDNVDKLMVMYKNGELGGEVMPEDANPNFEKDSLENYLYFTLPMALNYQRNSYTLWESALKTYNDEETRFVFNPKVCLEKSFEEVQYALTKYRVALQKQKQTEIWLTLCNTFVEMFDGDIRKLFDELDNDVNKIRDFIQKENKKKFPYLSGTKICNYWMYVIYQYTDRRYKNIECLTVAPDTHVCKATHRLGLITDDEFNSSNVQQIVIDRWQELFKGTKYKPIDIHTQLWLWSRNGFKEVKMNINDKEYEEISSTAIVTSYPRIFTDIPYEKEIYEWLSNHCNEEVTLNKMLAAEIEARYKLTNKLLDNSGIKQVLELAAGYSSRGLIYSNKGYNYVEMDLEKVIQNKTNIVQEIEKNIPNSLNIISGNALRSSDYSKCDEYFEPNKPIAVINEGLLRYLTFDEKRVVAENVYSFLKKHGGIWITCDVTPKKFIQSQDKALPNFNKNLNNVTSRNNITDRFENIEHIKEFFGNIGFEVSEIHKFSEVKDELYSINYHNLVNPNIEQSLDDAIVAVMKIKGEK